MCRTNDFGRKFRRKHQVRVPDGPNKPFQNDCRFSDFISEWFIIKSNIIILVMYVNVNNVIKVKFFCK